MSFFDKHKALIITFLFMGVFILTLHNIVLSKKSQKVSELLMELNVEEFLAENIPEEAPEQLPEPKEITRINKTHQAFNQDTKMDQEAFEQRFKELTEKLSPGSESNNESADSENGTATIAPEKKELEKKNDTGKSNEEERENIKETSNHDSSISYSLVKRKATNLPNPIYTCSKRGKIVVNIVVNDNGHVTNADINTAGSNSTNGCLYDSAIEYAMRSRFNTSSRATQLGTITYLFNY